ncbi:LacI family DNA-binding transcriptional regulator [Microlunatus sp. GCM10028923]|uniref:LacI family DNA-binding transcriptional regulator n=1 Tax=Microlunatus sp. GCM10028923 TaxID=3273400 RepID=UPI00361421F7
MTISDVARRAGVSIAAVSSALNGGHHVSDATRARIELVAAELGWAPASAARSLAGARTDTIGLMLQRDPESIGVESFHMQFLAGIERELSSRSYGLLLQIASTQGDALAKQVAGMLSATVVAADHPVPDLSKSRRRTAPYGGD